jgi:hypothetical protein
MCQCKQLHNRCNDNNKNDPAISNAAIKNIATQIKNHKASSDANKTSDQAINHKTTYLPLL